MRKRKVFTMEKYLWDFKEEYFSNKYGTNISLQDVFDKCREILKK